MHLQCNSYPAPANSSSFSYYWLCSHLVMYWISACSLNHSRTLAPSSMSCTYVISSRSKKCEMNYDSVLCHKRLIPCKKMCLPVLLHDPHHILVSVVLIQQWSFQLLWLSLQSKTAAMFNTFTSIMNLKS